LVEPEVRRRAPRPLQHPQRVLGRDARLPAGGCARVHLRRRLVETGFWDYDETFVTVGIILWVVVALVAFGFLGRSMSRAGARLEAEEPSPPLMLKIRNLVWTSRALLATLVVVVFVMTVKPGT
jgi:hypothetical protein